MNRALWTISEYRGRPGLEQLNTDWKRLYAAMPARRRYHAYEAQLAYLDHLCAEPERARYLALPDAGGSVRAICPLEPAPDPSLRLPLRAWALPSHHHWLATDALAPDSEAREALLPAVVAYLRRHREGRGLLLLGPMRGDSALCAQAAALSPGARCVHDTHPSAFFDCTVPYEQLQARMSKHFRRNLRSSENRLRAAGDVRLVTVSAAAGAGAGAGAGADPEGAVRAADEAAGFETAAAEFESFLEIEASGWKGRTGAGSAIRLRPQLVAFYRDLLTTMTAPDDRCEINSLHLDGRCIAAQFCVRTGEEYTILKIAYDEEFARLGPGQFLFQATLERCCADPAIKYIDLITDAPWMRDWRTELMPMQQSHVAIAPLWGRPLIALLRFRHGPARRMVQWYRAARAERQAPAAGRRVAE